MLEGHPFQHGYSDYKSFGSSWVAGNKRLIDVNWLTGAVFLVI